LNPRLPRCERKINTPAIQLAKTDYQEQIER
jgi:hypothetical protein